MRVLCFIAALWLVSACSALGPRARDVAPADPDRLVVVAVANPMTPMTRRAGGTPRAYGGSRYRVSPAAQQDLQALARAHGLTPVDAWPIEIIGVHCAVMRIDADKPRAAVLEQLKADPRVELVQPLQTFATRAGGYNDPYADLQVSLDSMNVRGAHGLATGKGVRVAVVDTGVDVEHPDLANRVLTKQDLVRNDFRGFTQDLHGTAVAGIIVAAANNSVGIVGVAPDARILALKACWYQEGSSTNGASTAHCNSFTLARAIAAAVDRDAQVINMSLAGPADPLIEKLLTAVMKRGILVISAVSDVGDDAARFPASMPGVIGVQMAESMAAHADDGYVRAPGQEILTLRPGAHYDFETGSSIAAANVTGVVALLLQHRSTLTSEEIRALLAASSAKVALRENATPGIDACAAVASLLAADSCPQPVLVRTARAHAQKKPLSAMK